MKKIICLSLVLCTLAFSLCSCFLLDENYGEDATTTAGLPSYAGNVVKEYDENGELILTSTDDRYVYSQEGGYVIFTFAGNSVKKIQTVKIFENEEAAQKYVTDTALQAVDEGKVPPNITVKGRYALENVAFDPANMTKLSSYYTKDRSAVEADYSEEAKR